MDHCSIAKIKEGELVGRLLLDQSRRWDILRLYGIPDDVLDFQQVNLKDVPGDSRARDGDIDILLCDPSRPDAAIAIEVKRVNVDAKGLHGLMRHKKGVKQANRLERIGFSQVYLFEFVVVDSREKHNGQISYAGAPTDLRHMIHRELSLRGLTARVGHVIFEFVQPMDYAPLNAGAPGTHGVFPKRLAEEVTQPVALTAWVAQKVARHVPSPAI